MPAAGGDEVRQQPGDLGRGRGADGDVGQLGGVGIGIDGAVAVYQHPIGQAHEKNAGDQGDPRFGADDLKGRPDGVAGGVHGAGHHPVHQPVRVVGHDDDRAVSRNALDLVLHSPVVEKRHAARDS